MKFLSLVIAVVVLSLVGLGIFINNDVEKRFIDSIENDKFDLFYHSDSIRMKANWYDASNIRDLSFPDTSNSSFYALNSKIIPQDLRLFYESEYLRGQKDITYNLTNIVLVCYADDKVTGLLFDRNRSWFYVTENKKRIPDLDRFNGKFLIESENGYFIYRYYY